MAIECIYGCSKVYDNLLFSDTDREIFVDYDNAIVHVGIKVGAVKKCFDIKADLLLVHLTKMWE